MQERRETGKTKDAEQMGHRTEEMQERRDAGQADLGQEETVKEGCRK